ncbi:MAG: sigma-70 family RNA polymerase sigma factor [Chloroflexi bacterium]|nr:MAG: sigma-70 family RNA polymerase sigma factor [Chloroflexota bacterium]
MGIPKRPERGLTNRCFTRTVRAPSHGEGRDLDQVFGGRAPERRGTLADSALLWARCREGDAAARCALIERFAPLATRIARGMNVPIGAVAGSDDLESAALIGLIDAVDRFDPERGVPFEGYASLRIRGAVLDEVRRVDELGRADRRRQREAAAQGEAGTYHGTVSLDELIERGYHGGAEQDEVAERYEAEDLRSRVRSAMTCLPPRQREVLERYYGQSLTLREAGLRMGISEARACQLHGRAIQNLRRQLSVVFHARVAAARIPVAA